jgi:YVTN family beta-propeller protein
MKRALLAGLLLVLSAFAWQAQRRGWLSSTVLLGKQATGEVLVPTNQLLQPWGEQTLLRGRPVDMTFDPEGRLIAVLNWRGVDVLDSASGAKVGGFPLRATSFAGLAFRPGTRELWTAELLDKDQDRLVFADIAPNGQASERRTLDLKNHPVPVGIAFSADGTKAYVALSRANSVLVVDAAAKRIESEVPVGLAPFGLLRVGNQLYVTNRGGRRPKPGETTAPSSGTDVLSDPTSGTAVSGTVSIIDLATRQAREVTVGRAPSLLTASPDGKWIAVANGHSDTVSLLEAATAKVIDVKVPTWPESAIGSQPIAAAFSPQGDRLYVACGGNNALAVIDVASRKATGAVPVGYFPSALLVDGQGALRVLNIKGMANTANSRGSFNSREYEGSLLRIPAPAAPQLASGVREVKRLNEPQFESNGGVRNLASLGIEHVLFIIKENRTYDQLFGAIGKGNSDPKLVMYGRDVTPNHHALAEQYVLLDNFYTGGAISFDGHQWLMQAFVSDYVERAFSSSPRGYTWNMADALTVAPTGFFWQGASKPLNVRIYGEFCLPGKWDPARRNVQDMKEDQELTWTEYWKAWKDGTWHDKIGCRPGVPALASIMDQRMAHDAMAINDQIRADEYLREFKEFEAKGVLPNVSVMLLNSDHTEGTKPGYPTPRAMVADNDLALGRIVEYASKSKFWPKMLILVVEDDAQDGVDHVDGHRTVALAVGPHVRRGALDSNHYNHTSMVRTIQEIFNVPARTRFLKSARAMNSVFQPKGDPQPYQALAPKIALDEMNPPLKALNGRARWAAEQSMKLDFEHVDRADHQILNRILWGAAKGWDVPYPSRR